MIEITFHILGDRAVIKVQVKNEAAIQGHIDDVRERGYVAMMVEPSVYYVYPWHMVERISWIVPDEA